MMRRSLLIGLTLCLALWGSTARAVLLKKIPHPTNRAMWAELHKLSPQVTAVYVTENSGRWAFRVSPEVLDTQWKVFGERTAVAASWSAKGSYLLITMKPRSFTPRDLPDLYIYSVEGHYGAHIAMPYCQSVCEYPADPSWVMKPGHLSYKRTAGKSTQWIHYDLRSGVSQNQRDPYPMVSYLLKSLIIGLPQAAAGKSDVLKKGLSALPEQIRYSVESYLGDYRSSWRKQPTLNSTYCKLEQKNCSGDQWEMSFSLGEEALIFQFDRVSNELIVAATQTD